MQNLKFPLTGALLLGLILSPVAQAKIMPDEHWDRCINSLYVTDTDLVSEMRQKSPPLVTEGDYYLDFSSVEADCGPWIWKVMGQDHTRAGEPELWLRLIRKLFYHFSQNEIPGLDDREALRRETCPSPYDRRMSGHTALE